MSKNTIIAGIIIILLIGGFYWWNKSASNEMVDNTTAGENATSTTPAETPTTPVVHPVTPTITLPANLKSTIIASIAKDRGVASDRVAIIGVTERQWPNSCLGLGGTTEMCLQVITPGYRVETLVNGVGINFRTNKTGTLVKIEHV